MEFESAQDISTLKDWVNKVEKFFQFLSHRKKIKFSEISVYQTKEIIHQNQKFNYDDKGGNFYTLTNQNEEYHLPDKEITCPVSFYFPKIGKLFEILNADKMNFNYIPTDNKEYSTSIDAKQCLKYSGSFEQNYEYLFERTSNKDMLQQEVVQKIQDCISIIKKEIHNAEDVNRKNKKIKLSTCDNISRHLERNINSLESKYNRCFNLYKNIIQDVFPQLDDKCEKEKNWGNIFSCYRNECAHGEDTKSSINIKTYDKYQACKICEILIRCLI